MARLDPRADPIRSIADGLHVAPPGDTVFAALRARLELQPCSSHLLLGQIGSGKTTQLRLLEQELKGDVQPIYIDVSEKLALTEVEVGALMVLAGLSMSERLVDETSPEIVVTIKHFKRWAHGSSFIQELRDHGWEVIGELLGTTPGIIQPPSLGMGHSVAEKSQSLSTLVKATGDATPIFLFDGLDRTADLKIWQDILNNDVIGLTRAGVGVVLVAPLTLLYGTHRPLTQSVDRVHRQPIVDPEDPAGAAFLRDILNRRAGDLFDADATTALCHWSGGIPRDLIALARTAVEETYVSGRDRVTVNEVDLAASTFGRELIMGLTKDDLALLDRVRRDGTFIPTDDTAYALLLSRRVLEYGAGPHRYALHPTLAPLLEQLAA